HFTPQTDRPVLAVSDYSTFFFDEQKDLYRSYHKIERQKPGWDRARRCMSLAESKDGLQFGSSTSVLEPEEADDASAKSKGGIRAEFYGVHVWPQDGFYLGLLWMFMVTKNGAPPYGTGWDDGYIAPQLIYSADGIAWKRLPVREAFIPLGPAGSF